MIAFLDVIVFMTVVFSGCLIAGWAGTPQRLVLPLGTLAGVALQMASVAAATMLGLNRPGLVGFIAVPVVAAVLARRAARTLAATWIPVLVSAGLVIRWLAYPYTFLRHVDSVNYMIISGLLMRDDGDLAGEVNPQQLKKRMLGTPAMHAMQTLGDEPMSYVYGPWIALMCLVMIYVVVRTFGPKGWIGLLVGALGVGVLATSSRFLMNITYLNSHLVSGFALMTGLGAIAILRADPNQRRVMLLALTSAVAIIVLTRPEGFILAGMLVFSIFLDRAVAALDRELIVRGFGVAVVLSSMSLLLLFATRDELAYDSEVVLPLVLGLIAIGAARLARRTVWFGSTYGLLLIIGGMVTVATALVAREREIAGEMVSVWWGNYVTDGHWGWSLVIAFPAALIIGFALIRTDVLRPSTMVVLLFPMLGLITSTLRATPGRVSDADSFNRMTMHIYPTMIMLLAMGVAIRISERAQSAD